MSGSESEHRGDLRSRLVRLRGSVSLVVALVGLASPAFSGAAGATSVPSATSPHAVARCSAGELVIWLDTTGNGTAGSTYYNLEFTNLGRSSCSLAGFPGVSAIGLSGAQVGLPAARSDLPTVPVIDLAPDRTATSFLQLTDTGNFPGAQCRQVMAAGLRVYAPGATTAKTIAYPFEACSLAKDTFLHVRPMEKGVLPQ